MANAWPLKLATIWSRVLEPFSRWSSVIGNVALTAMILTIVAEVIARNVLRVSLPGTIELVEVLLVLVVFSGMAYASLRKSHIKVGILADRFSPTTKLVISVGTNLVALGMISIISWQNVAQAQYLWTTHLHSGILEIPIWPFILAAAAFMGLFTLAVVVDFLESLGKLLASGTRNYLWLIPIVLLVLLLFLTAFWPSMLPIGIAPEYFGIITLLLLFVLIFSGLHIGAAMAMATLWGMGYLSSTSAGLALLGTSAQLVASNYVWSVVPMFTFMGLLVAGAAYSTDLYRAAHKWLGNTPGGLASASVGACGALAAVTGSSLTGIVTLGTIGLPEMKAYKYDDGLAAGCIAAGSTIGILIPPSLGFIVYGIMVEVSIGRLFIAGILPGILLTLALILSIYVRCRLNPTLGPPGPTSSFSEKVASLSGTWPVILLFLVVIGGIYSGVITPNEAGAIGAFVVVVIGLVTRRFSVKNFGKLNSISSDTVRLTCIIFFMLIFATALAKFFANTNLPFLLADFIIQVGVSQYATLGVILFVFLILGCLLPVIPALMMVLPIVFPTVIAFGFDPIWFGVVTVLMMEIGELTPPIGINVFVMAGVAKDVPMSTIFRGVFPFWLVIFGVIFVLVLFPQIALFLPNLMKGG